MIALQQPATVLGPVIGWMKWTLFLPMLVAMLAVLRGGGVSGWGVWAMLAVCSAVAAASAARVPWRRGAHLGLNFWFALTLFLMEVFWDGIVGVWSGVLGGFFGVCALFGADWVARWGLARLPLGAPDAKRIRLWLYSGS